MDVPRFGSLPGFGSMLAAAGLSGVSARPAARRAPEPEAVEPQPAAPVAVLTAPKRRHLHPLRAQSRAAGRRLVEA